MNVLFISSDSGTAGSNQSLVALATILKENYNVNVTIVLASNGPIEEKLRKNEISYYIIKHYVWVTTVDSNSKLASIKGKYKYLFNILGEIKLSRLIKKKSIDIIHINTISTGFGAKSALKNNKPLIWHIREFLDLDLNAKFNDPNHSIRLINESATIIAISDSIGNYFSSKLDPSKITRIYNGIEEMNYKKINNHILENDSITLTIAGRLTEPKGHIDAIKATSNLVKQGYNIKLQIVGSNEATEYVNRLKTLIIEESIENNVDFLGYISNIDEVWTDTDIALICSKAEAFGRVTIEAMMGGAIVIGANTMGTSELIDDKYGYTYKHGDYNNLSDVIKYAINNRSKSQYIAGIARQYALENFTAKKNAENIYDLYIEILDNKK